MLHSLGNMLQALSLLIAISGEGQTTIDLKSMTSRLVCVFQPRTGIS